MFEKRAFSNASQGQHALALKQQDLGIQQLGSMQSESVLNYSLASH